MKPDLHGSRIVLRSIQTNDSDDLFGYSDVLSLSSNSTFSIDNVKENFEDIMRNLHATRTYLDSANF